jgi:hypothetical protein
MDGAVAKGKTVDDVAASGKTADEVEELGIGGVKNVPLSKAKIDEIISTPKGKRPLPEEYLSADYIKNHLSQFDDGSARIASKKAIEKFGTAGPNPSYVMPKPYVDKVIKEANGDIGKIEEALGYPKGSWDPDDIVIVEIPPTKGIKIPSGNERGANEMWKPGGVTSGGVPEAVTKLPPLDETTIKPLF